ncbi:MAG: MmgE/PrpD family protein [Chloroflexi bacterium]|nr:MmgE/PrpD family protein [Chloroflexota bacterium]
MTTRKIAEFCSVMRYDDLPEAAVSAAKRGILDYLGVTLAGSREPEGRLLAQYAKRVGTVKEASVFGLDFATSAEYAAWINGTMSHVLEYDDTFANTVGYNIHPSVSVLPAVLALGEKLGSSGKDTLAAYVAGMEAQYRVGAVLGLRLAELGWNSTGVVGSIAATAAASNLLKLDTPKAQRAIGIAAAFAAGILRNSGTMAKPMYAGNGARNGVVAGLLAEIGYTGNESILETDFGYLVVFSGGKAGDLAEVASDLGKTWYLVKHGLGFKPYPSCRSTHCSIDAALHIRKEYGVDLNEAAEIVCKINPIHTRLARFHQPKTGYEGRFSIPYCVVTALGRGNVSLNDFTTEKVNQAQYLFSKVSFVHPEGWAGGMMDLNTEIIVKTKNGKEYSRHVAVPKGEPKNAMTNDELSHKFRECASVVLDSRDVQKVLDMVWHWEDIENTRSLMKIVARPARSGLI